MPDGALKTQGFFQGQHRGPRQSWKEGQDWQAEGRMGLGRGVPHGARTFHVVALRPVAEPIPGLKAQVTAVRVGGGWRERLPISPAPGPSAGCKQTHALAVANRRGPWGGGGLLRT